MKHPEVIENKHPTAPPIWFLTACRDAGISMTDAQMSDLGRYVGLLREWNTVINLISRKDIDAIWENHIAHALSPFMKIRIPNKALILDLGTGGGLPGIPWRIACPSVSITMIDSTQKKINAVESMVKTLGLTRTEAVWGRAEELGRLPRFKGYFDYVVARAIGPLQDLARLASSFLSTGQVLAAKDPDKRVPAQPALLAFKGGPIDEEIKKTQGLRNVRSVEVIPLSFPGLDTLTMNDKKLVVVVFEHGRAAA